MAFLDETGHTFRARVGTTWAPRGRPPVLRRLSKRREVSSLVVLTAPLDGQPPRLYARHVIGSVHAAEVIAALRYVRRGLDRPLVIVWDRLNAHRAAVVQAFVARHRADVVVEWLPGYAPDLNPEELCNGAVKQAMLNATPGSIEALRNQARREFRRLGRRPDVLDAFFHHTGLDVTNQSLV